MIWFWLYDNAVHTHTGNWSPTAGHQRRCPEGLLGLLVREDGGGVTGYLDKQPHFTLACTISVNGGQIPADAARVSGQWITYLEKSKSATERVIWTEGQQNRQKCETWRKRDAHWGNPLPAEKPTSMKRAVSLNCLLDKAGLRFGKALRGTASGVRQREQGGLPGYSAALSDGFLPPAGDFSLQLGEVSPKEINSNKHACTALVLKVNHESSLPTVVPTLEQNFWQPVASHSAPIAKQQTTRLMWKTNTGTQKKRRGSQA